MGVFEASCANDGPSGERDSGSGYRGRPKYKKTMAMRQVLVSLVRQLLIQGNSQSQTNQDC